MCKKVAKRDMELLRRDEEQGKWDEKALHAEKAFVYTLVYKVIKSTAYVMFANKCCNVLPPIGFTKALSEIMKVRPDLNLCDTVLL